VSGVPLEVERRFSDPIRIESGRESFRKERTAVERTYHSPSQKHITTIHKDDTQALARFLTRSEQALLPIVELIEPSRLGVR